MKCISPVTPTRVFCRKTPPGILEQVEDRAASPARSWTSCAAVATLTGVCLAPQVQAASVTKQVAKHNPELSSLFTRSSTQVGEYTLNFRPADLDVAPKLSHGKPGLRVKGEFLDAELAKATPLESNWTRVQGLRGRLQGELTTVGDHRASVHLEAFRRWEGSFSNGMQAKFEVSGGSYHNLLDSTTSVGFNLRQEVKGGNFRWHNQPLSWHLEGRQGISQRLGDGPSGQPAKQFNYEFLVGLRRDYPMTIFGKTAVVSTVIGPEFHGNQNRSLEVSPKVKVRVHL